jgi:hypothetical protein
MLVPGRTRWLLCVGVFGWHSSWGSFDCWHTHTVVPNVTDAGLKDFSAALSSSSTITTVLLYSKYEWLLCVCMSGPVRWCACGVCSVEGWVCVCVCVCVIFGKCTTSALMLAPGRTRWLLCGCVWVALLVGLVLIAGTRTHSNTNPSLDRTHPTCTPTYGPTHANTQQPFILTIKQHRGDCRAGAQGSTEVFQASVRDIGNHCVRVPAIKRAPRGVPPKHTHTQ